MGAQHASLSPGGLHRPTVHHAFAAGAATSPAWWPVLPLAVAVRAVAAYIVSRRVLSARLNWALLPIEDLMGFFFWIAGFVGNTITWRGRRYRLSADGRFELISEPAANG
jgi:ceramide glucosyltransferase